MAYYVSEKLYDEETKEMTKTCKVEIAYIDDQINWGNFDR